MPEKIQKRDGRLETWSVDRIARAILKSLRASGIKDPLLAHRLAKKVEGYLLDVPVPEQEEVQDIVEQVLMESRLFSVARKYVLYREKRREIRSQNQAFLDVTDTIDTYVRGKAPEPSEREIPHSFHGLAVHLSGAVQKRYALEQYPEEIRMAHENGYLHIHQLSFGMAGYSAGWSLGKLFAQGFGFKGVCCFGPPRHFDAALGQMVTFLGAMQSEWASAQSLSHVDTLLAPFVRADGLGYEQVRHCMHTFVHALNGFSRGGDPVIPCSLALDGEPALTGENAYIAGMSALGTYDEYGPEVEMINRALGDVLCQGDHLGQPFASPVVVYDVSLQSSWIRTVKDTFFRLAQRGGPLYCRFVADDGLRAEPGAGSGTGISSGRAGHQKWSGFPYAASEMTGSIGVVSLNLPKLAFLAQGETDFLDLIAEYAEYARDALEFKRKFMTGYMERGMFPYSRHYLEHGLDHHAGTLGLLGGHEACMNLLGKGIGSQEGTALMIRVLKGMGGLVQHFTRETGHPYTVTSIMDNQACYRLAGIDKELYAEIVFSGNGTPRYTNGMYLPVGHGLGDAEWMKYQGTLLPLFSGGAVALLNLSRGADSEQLVAMVRKIFSETQISVMCVRNETLPCEISCGKGVK